MNSSAAGLIREQVYLFDGEGQIIWRFVVNGVPQQLSGSVRAVVRVVDGHARVAYRRVRIALTIVDQNSKGRGGAYSIALEGAPPGALCGDVAEGHWTLEMTTETVAFDDDELSATGWFRDKNTNGWVAEGAFELLLALAPRARR